MASCECNKVKTGLLSISLGVPPLLVVGGGCKCHRQVQYVYRKVLRVIEAGDRSTLSL